MQVKPSQLMLLIAAPLAGRYAEDETLNSSGSAFFTNLIQLKIAEGWMIVSFGDWQLFRQDSWRIYAGTM